MSTARLLLLSLPACAFFAAAQTTPQQMRAMLEPPLQTPDVVAFQLRHYLLKKIPKLPPASSAAQWTSEAKRLRESVLKDVVYHGWPREWVEAPLKVEDLGLMPSGPGYRMRKLRYEIVPGMLSSAILYEPEKMNGKAPAILNVNGHVGPPGKSVEYKQKRCINQAKQGILSLNLEWLSFGELSHPENVHWFAAHLDLTGANAAGLFYLAMRKGLDFLYDHPNTDRSRIGVTGLSGGGWQTIVLSSLDERVAVAVPVAGYSSLRSRIERPGDTGDIEQNATDMLTLADYPHLTAMRAPRPTLLVYNAEDDCCFRGPLVKPFIYDEVRPFFRLFGKEAALEWHENTDPSDHNYQLDNRQQGYRFFATHFGMPPAGSEIPVDSEIKSYDELVVGLPKDNLTILGVAKKLASMREQAAPATAGKAELASTVRIRETKVAEVLAVRSSKAKGLETRSYRFDFENGLSAAGVWLKAIAEPAGAPATIVLNDKGKKSAGEVASDRVNRGEQVLAADLVFTGDGAPEDTHLYAEMLAATGDRALGLEAAQLAALASWLGSQTGAGKVRLEAAGIRSQVTALMTATLYPDLFSDVVVREGMESLRHLLDKPVEYQAAPDLFCLGLYPEFDVARLEKMRR
ncbi:MAG TPA: hypothetical protein VLE22_03045 [Bryobacteraceae bacterium]|nr:hypothetical protein [Bryobacteraceae bacterium]